MFIKEKDAERISKTKKGINILETKMQENYICNFYWVKI